MERPIAPSAEQSMIGCLFLGNNAVEVFANVNGDDFINPDAKELYFSLQEQWLQTKKIDIGAVPKKHMQLAVQCVDICQSISNWRSYVEQMKRDAQERRIDNDLYRLSYHEMTLEEKYEAAERILAQRQGESKVRRMNMAQARRAFFMEQEKEADYLHTGISKLDDTANIERGDYVVLGARPSVGKTAFALQIARSIAKSGKRVVFYSYETTIEKLQGRTMAGHCGIKMDKIKKHVVKGAGTEHLGADLDDMQLEFVESSGMGASWIKADIVMNQADVVFIDYIGLIPTRGASRFEEITKNSLDIRHICQNTGATAFVLCQINRNGHAAPTKEDLKESGQIEQDADVILLLHNPVDLEEREEKNEIHLIVAKNKEGRVGKINLMMDGATQKFYDMETRYE